MRAKDKELVLNTIMQRIKRLEIILQQGGAADANRQKKISSDDESARLDSLNQQPVDDALLNLARLELSELEHNRERLEKDDAGTCEECGCEIPIKRLIAVPTTRRCVKCAADMS